MSNLLDMRSLYEDGTPEYKKSKQKIIIMHCFLMILFYLQLRKRTLTDINMSDPSDKIPQKSREVQGNLVITNSDTTAPYLTHINMCNQSPIGHR